MNKYDIDEQFLNEAWDKMRQQLDSELPLQKPWYYNKMWYAAGLAATLLLFTGLQCLKFKNYNSTTANAISNKQETNNNNNTVNTDNNIGNANNNTQKILGTNKTIISNKTNTISADKEQNFSAKAQNNSINQKNTYTPSNTKENFVTPPVTISHSTAKTALNAKLKTYNNALKNINISNTNNKHLYINSLQNFKNTTNETIVTKDDFVDFIPSINSNLNSNEIGLELAASPSDIPNTKIWQPKKPFTFGLTMGLNTNIKDASSFRAGLFGNYIFNKNLMLGASVAYNYTAINTNYEVSYNVPVPPDPQQIQTQDIPLESFTEKNINDEINFNTNYQGINVKLMFTYFPIKRLGITGGLFGTRYILNNSDFDFLASNIAYAGRTLSSNYGYNKYKAGPAFELQYWVKPKLTIAATLEMNLVPEVKQEFWATADKQDYLRNSFGVALQYQFN